MMAMSAITRVSVGPDKEHPLFGEQVISVELEDEGPRKYGACKDAWLQVQHTTKTKKPPNSHPRRSS